MRDHINRLPLYYLLYQGMSDPVGALKMTQETSTGSIQIDHINRMITLCVIT